MNNLNDRLLLVAQRAYEAYLTFGPRSNVKLKILHGWIKDEVKKVLGHKYEVFGLSESDGSEYRVEGMYYRKKTDLCVTRKGKSLGVISVKFIQSNYIQNKNNYFEQQLGETANLRANDIVFGHMMCFTEPIPYLDRGGTVKRYDHISDEVILRYNKLAMDHQHPHVPDVQAICVFLLDADSNSIVRICEKSDLPNISNESYRLLTGRMSVENFVRRFCKSVELNWEKKSN